MDRKKKFAIIALVSLVSIAAITAVLAVFDPAGDGTNAVTEAQTTVEVQEDTAQVTVDDLGGASEVVVKSSSDQVTVSEAGETVELDVEEGSSIVVQTPEGETLDRVYVDSTGTANQTQVIENSEEWQKVHNGMAGKGSPTNPYIVTDARELQSIRVEPSAHYKLGQDIDASATQDWNDGAGFIPISQFSGSFNGDGYGISNLYIDRSGTENVGLFAQTDGASISDLSLDQVDITGANHTGGLAGQLKDSEVSAVSVGGSITGQNYVGGVAGLTNPTTIKNSEVDEANVSGEEVVGGFVGVHNGVLSKSSISNSEVSGNKYIGGAAGRTKSEASTEAVTGAETLSVSGTTAVGGLVGVEEDNSVVRASKFGGTVEGETNVGGIVGTANTSQKSVVMSASRGDVSGTENVGGIIGKSQSGWITDSYSSGSVSGTQVVGGIVGTQTDGIINTSYTQASVSGEQIVGVVAGSVSGVSSNGVYWVKSSSSGEDDSDSEGGSEESESSLSAVGEGIQFGTQTTVSNVTGESAELNMSEFNFEDIWSTTDDGPVLLESEQLLETNQQEDDDDDSGPEEANTAELTLELKNSSGEDVIGQVQVNEETYAVSGSRTIEVQQNSEYVLTGSSEGYTEAERTVFIENQPRTVTLELSQLSGSAEAIVRIQNEDGEKLSGTISLGSRTKTTTDGLASFVVERGEEYTAQAQAPGYAYREENVVIDSDVKEITLTMSENNESTTQVTVKLKDVNTGDLIDGFVRSGGNEYEVTDGIGIFTLPANQLHEAEFGSEGYITKTDEISVGDSPKLVTKELEPGAVDLTVRILDEQTEEPLVGEVTVNGELHSVDGSKAIEVTKYKEYNVKASVDDYAANSKTVSMGSSSQEVTLKLNRQTSTLTVNLVNADGDALDGSLNIDGTTYDVQDGTKSVELGINQDHEVTADAQGYESKSQVISLGEEDKEVQFSLEKRIVGLTVEVRDFEGNPMSGTITVGDKTVEADSGSYTFNVLAESTKEISVEAPDYQTSTQTIELSTQPETVTVQLQPEQVDLNVDLVDEQSGDSITGEVTVDGETKSVDSETTFTVQKFKTYTVEASAEDYATLNKDITMGDSSKSVILSLDHAKVGLSVRLQSVSGSSLTGVVTLNGTQYGVNDGSEVIQVRTNTDYEVVANAENYLKSTKTLSVKESDESIKFSLEPDTVGLTVDLNDKETGDPITAQVTLEGDTSVVDGSKTFQVFKNQDVDISVEGEDYVNQDRTVTVNESAMTETFSVKHKEVDLTLTLENDVGESVEGEVTFAGETRSINGTETFSVRVNDTYDITADAVDHDQKSQSVEVDMSNLSETIVLTKHKAELGLEMVNKETGNPLSGVVTIDGQSYAINGDRVFNLGVNETYEVTGDAEDFHSNTVSIELNEDPITRTIELESIGVILDLNLEDDTTGESLSGTINVNDKTYSTDETIEVPVNDTYTVTAGSTDYKDYQTEIEVNESDIQRTFQMDHKEVDYIVDLRSADTGDLLTGEVTVNPAERSSRTVSVDGSKTLTLRVNESYDITANAPDYESSYEQVDIGTSNVSKTFELVQETRDLTVVLEDNADGSSLSGTVTLLGKNYSVDGSKTFSVPVNDTYTVSANADKYYKETKDVEMNESDKTVTFGLVSKQTEMTIELSDVETGDALSGEVAFNGNTYSVDGSKTFTVDKNTDYTVSTNVPDHFDKEDTVTVASDPVTKTFELEKDYTELTVELRHSVTGDAINGTLDFRNESYSVNGSETFTVTRYKDYDLNANSSDFYSNSKLVSVNDSPKTATIELQPKTVILSVRFEDEDGNALDGDAIVDTDRTFAVTDGTADIELQQNRSYDIESDVSGYVPETKTVSLGESDSSVTFSLKAESTDLTVNLEDKDNGDPLDGTLTFGNGDTYSVSSGQTTISVLKYDDYDITAESGTHYKQKTRTISVESGPKTVTFNIDHKMSDLTVEIEDKANGNLVDGSVAFDGNTYSVDNGTRTFTLRANHDYDLTADKSDYTSVSKTVSLGESDMTETFTIEHETVPFDITLEDSRDGSSLSGDVELVTSDNSKTVAIDGTGSTEARVNQTYDIAINVPNYKQVTDTVSFGTSSESRTYQLSPKTTELTIKVVESKTNWGPNQDSVSINLTDSGGYTRSETIDVTTTTNSNGNEVPYAEQTFDVQINEDFNVTANAPEYKEASASVSIGETSESITITMYPEEVQYDFDLIDAETGDSIPDGKVYVLGGDYDTLSEMDGTEGDYEYNWVWHDGSPGFFIGPNGGYYWFSGYYNGWWSGGGLNIYDGSTWPSGGLSGCGCGWDYGSGSWSYNFHSGYDYTLILGGNNGYWEKEVTYTPGDSGQIEEVQLTKNHTDMTISLQDEESGDKISGNVYIDGGLSSEDVSSKATDFNGDTAYAVDTSGQAFDVTRQNDYQITAESADYFDKSVTVSVADQPVNEAINLEPRYTQLTIEITDDDRDLLIDDSILTFEGTSEQLADGKKELKVERYKDYSASADADNYFASSTQTISIEDKPKTYTFNLSPKTVDVTLKLRDSGTGELVPGEKIEVYDGTYEVGSDGKVTIPMKVNDTYTATPKTTDYKDESESFSVGESDMEYIIDLNHKKVDLTIQVKDEATSDSISNAIVNFKGQDYEVTADGVVFTVRVNDSYDVSGKAIGYHDETASVSVAEQDETYEFTLGEIILNGDGTADNPYEISNAEHLQMMREEPSAYYKLTTDIDASVTRDYDLGNGFDPIGTATVPFSGGLYGNGYKISGLYIDRPNDPASMLGVTDGAVVRNIEMVNPTINGSNAATISTDFSGTMKRIGVRGGEGKITGGLEAAGLAVNFSSGKIVKSYNTVTVEGADSASGLVGLQEDTVSDSYAAATLMADDSSYLHGAIGSSTNTSAVTDTYWDTEASGTTNSAAGSGLTTTKMTGDSASTNMAFDFGTIWNETSGYPRLNWAAVLKGSGTESDPYIITDAKQLQRINDDLSSYYKLGNDIDASGTKDWNNGAGFKPLGSGSTPFLGGFDGAGHTITGLYIDRPNGDYIGMFGSTDGVIENVKLKDATIYGSSNVGAIAGETTTTIREVAVAGGSVTQNADESGDSGAGGVAGITVGTSAEVVSSYSTAEVNGDMDVGGLIGNGGDGTVAQYSFAAGTVTGGDSTTTGGLIGYSTEDDGDSTYPANSSYWDTEATGQTSSQGGTGLTTSEMTGTSASDNMNLDFSSTWNTTGTYPELHWWSS